MKKFLLILTLFFCTGISLHAQDEDPAVQEDQGSRIQQRMQEYIQRRLNMNRAEAERFSPVFIRYLLELKRTHRDFKTDRPMLQLKIAELRVRFRTEFRQVLDERRGDRVFEAEGEFKKIVVRELQQREMQRRGGLRRNRSMLD